MFSNTIVDDLEKDWRKLAAAAAQQDRGAVERAFCDQAFSAIQNKAQMIMKPPFRVGFEIVHKNDNDTRMVGVFIFRVGKDYFYAPVFFINGSIKGTDLFYEHTKKRFVPLTNDWVEYLINIDPLDEGKGVPVKERGNYRNEINLRGVIESPTTRFNNTKYASAKEAYEGMCALALELLSPAYKSASLVGGSILRRFIETDGGFNAITKLANTAKHDFDFANALHLGSKADNYAPALSYRCKQASDGVTGKLVIHMGVGRNSNIKQASTTDVLQGYQLEDNRKSAEINDTIYDAASEDFQSINGPGVYKVLTTDGLNEMLCGYADSLVPLYAKSEFGCSPSMCVDSDPIKRIRAISLGSHGTRTGRKELFGQFVTDEVASNPALLDKPEAKKAYSIFNLHDKTLSDPMYVTEITAGDNGLSQVSMVRSYTDSTNPVVFQLNPDFDLFDYDAFILGKCCKFVEVKFEVNDSKHIDYKAGFEFGSDSTLTDYLLNAGFKQASVQKLQDGYWLFKGKSQPTWSAPLTKLSAKLALMVEPKVNEAMAEDILKKAEAAKDQRYSFYYTDATKTALNLRFDEFPQFQEGYDSDFGVATEGNSRAIIPAGRDEPEIERSRIGDAYSQETSDTIDTMNPMQLYELSQSQGMDNLFEHGVVGSLVNTYDAVSLIEGWAPDLEKALDRVGRIIFLYYWKPEDFAQAYGSDDQTQLENKLTSTFKSYGDLVLELLRKTQNRQQGTASLT